MYVMLGVVEFGSLKAMNESCTAFVCFLKSDFPLMLADNYRTSWELGVSNCIVVSISLISLRSLSIYMYMNL